MSHVLTSDKYRVCTQVLSNLSEIRENMASRQALKENCCSARRMGVTYPENMRLVIKIQCSLDITLVFKLYLFICIYLLKLIRKTI
jgi:hypothetical protein